MNSDKHADFLLIKKLISRALFQSILLHMTANCQPLKYCISLLSKSEDERFKNKCVSGPATGQWEHGVQPPAHCYLLKIFRFSTFSNKSVVDPVVVSLTKNTETSFLKGFSSKIILTMRSSRKTLVSFVICICEHAE